MSELLVNTIKKADGTGSLTVPAESGTVVTTASPSLGRRNLIINGAMQVAQRGTSATGIGNGDSGTYNTVDRWKWQYSGSITSEYTESQSTDSPDDFSFSRKFECTTAGTGHNYIEMFQPIEAQNLTQLNYGTASAKTITLSFWAKCSQTGTGSVFVYSSDSGRAFTGNYTISAVDTWEYKTISITGDTAGSGIASDTGEGLRVSFGLAAASGYTSGTADTWAAYDNANRYAGLTLDISSGIGEYLSITGVQLEVGSVATPFEHRSYGEELALCERYCETFTRYGEGLGSGDNNIIFASGYATSSGFIHVFYRTRKRTHTPDVTYTVGADGGTSSLYGKSDNYLSIYSPTDATWYISELIVEDEL